MTERFVDVGLEAEVAFDSNGNAKAGMGVDAGDVNGDGRPECVWSRISISNTFPISQSWRPPFLKIDAASHLAGTTRLDVGWGVHFVSTLIMMDFST